MAEAGDRVALVLTALPDEVSAVRLADALVAARLAACASVGAPMRSVYHWQGARETATETPLTIKTFFSRLDAVRIFIESHHPYEVPEIVAIEAAGVSDAYLAWMREELGIDANDNS